VLEEDAVLLEDAKRSQIVGSKCKEVISRNEKRQQLSKKAKEK